MYLLKPHVSTCSEDMCHHTHCSSYVQKDFILTQKISMLTFSIG